MRLVRYPATLRNSELLRCRRLARVRERLAVVPPEEEQVHLGGFHTSQAGIPAGAGLGREVLEAPRLMAGGLQQAREIATLILQSAPHRGDEHDHGGKVTRARDPQWQ